MQNLIQLSVLFVNDMKKLFYYKKNIFELRILRKKYNFFKG